MTTPFRLLLRETDGIRRVSEPVTVGVPLPRGRLRDPAAAALWAGARQVPLQTEALARWPDGSVRWLLLDFPADVDARGTEQLTFLPDGGSPEAADPSSLRVGRSGRGFFVQTGTAMFAVDASAFLPLRSARTGGMERVDPARSGWTCTDAGGAEWRAVADDPVLETEGPLRSVIRLAGRMTRDGAERPLLDFVARLAFHRDSASVRVTFSVVNPRRARHPGGHWELGDPGSVMLKELSLRIAAARAGAVAWSVEPGTPLGTRTAGPVQLFQDSSGGENWQSPVHRDRTGSLPMTFRGYRLRVAGEQRDGARATPRIAAHHDGSGVGISVRHFWQNFPQAMEADDGTVTLRLLPGLCARPHEIQGGERKTWEFWLHFGPDATAAALDGLRAPLRAVPEPGWFAASGVLPYVVPAADSPDALYERLVAAAVEGGDSLLAKRERADEYGWRHFGELWADHESLYHEGDDLFVSHFNNQYDVIHGAFLQYARSGDPRWLEILEPLARHVADIDVYHTDEDKPAYNHGLFWHTAHYVPAGLATHRSYPRGTTVGGGPDNEHNYATGFADWYFLTGDPQGREALLERAQWIVDADDGERSRPFRLLARGATGLATKTRELGFHGPGRGAGNSVQVLLDAWRMTGDESWLGRATEIVHRTVHPSDDPEALGLADPETRWSYTVHLQALGRFLDELAADGRRDEPYAYARETLLTYARWMAEHERPALESPERLEHPTETWAMQDVRKSEVFRFASLHAENAERELFRERAEFFHRHSLETLEGFESRTRTRPLALLMRYGLMDAWCRTNPDERRPAPAWTGTFPPPRRFVPQKAVAMRRARWIVLAGAAALVLGAAALLLRA